MNTTSDVACGYLFFRGILCASKLVWSVCVLLRYLSVSNIGIFKGKMKSPIDIVLGQFFSF